MSKKINNNKEGNDKKSSPSLWCRLCYYFGTQQHLSQNCICYETVHTRILQYENDTWAEVWLVFVRHCLTYILCQVRVHFLSCEYNKNGNDKKSSPLLWCRSGD